MSSLSTINDLSTYSPEEAGALCQDCPLRDQRQKGRFVPPELRPLAIQLHVAEAPGSVEVELHRPLVGPSGSEHSRAVIAAGGTRDELSLTNALLCKPTGGNLKRYLAVLSKRNKTRKSRGKDPHPSPLDCCWPRLQGEVLQHSSLLLLGAYARTAVYSRDASGAAAGGERGEKKLMAQRGFPDELCFEGVLGDHWVSVLSTVHPAFVLRRRRWTAIYRHDVEKARRMALRALRLREPTMVFAPSPARLRVLLERMEASGKVIAYDLETDGLESTECHIRCIGIGTEDLVVIVPWRSVSPNQWRDGMAAWYSPAQELAVKATLREFFGRGDNAIADQNGLYDIEVIERHGVSMKRRRFDTAIGHHVIHSEWRHDLAFQGAQYTDQLAWKAVDHDRWEHDVDLWRYCAFDVGQTALIAGRQAADERLQAQLEVFRADMRLSAFCRGLHAVGMKIDVEAQKEEGERLGAKMAEAETEARRVSRRPGLNIASTSQIRDFLFRECGVTPVPKDDGGLTDTGELSVKKDALIYLTDAGLSPELEEFVNAVIDYREAEKLRSNLCVKKDGTNPLRLCRDGRVRPSWNPHVVVTGRLSTSDPNVMNIKGTMRRLFCAEPGKLLVACDKAQLELRIMAWLAQDMLLVQAFLRGVDVHSVNACSVLGIDKPENVTKAQRRFTKTFWYAAQYGAWIPKVHSMVKHYREPDGSRPNKWYTPGHAETNYKRMWREHKPIKEYNEAGLREWKEKGFLESPLIGRRRYFLDGSGGDEEKEQVYNYRVQSCAADDVNAAIDRVVEAYPIQADLSGPTVVHYNYDSLMLEVPAKDALEVGRHVQELMYSELNVPGISGSMPLPVDLAIGPSWGELEEPDEPAKCKGQWWVKVDGAKALGLEGAYS